MRAPGMTLMRMPMFVWMTLRRRSSCIVLAFPVITVALILLMFDRFFGTHFFDAGRRAAIRCSGSTSSGSSATPRSTS